MVFEMDSLKSGTTPGKAVSWTDLLFHDKDYENRVPHQNLSVWTASAPAMSGTAEEAALL